jgi:hypothetical protein
MTMHLTQQDRGQLSLHVEELESLDQPDFDDFVAGLGDGLAVVGLFAAGVGIAVT